MDKFKNVVEFFKANTKMMFVYRGITMIWIINGLLGAYAAIMLWKSVDGKEALIGGYTTNQLVTYYLLNFLLSWIIGWYSFYELHRDIKEGSIIPKILKPYSYLLGRVGDELAWHTIPFLLAAVSSVGLFAAFRTQLTPPVGSWQLWLLPLVIAQGALIILLVTTCLATAAFWLTDAGFLRSFFWMIHAFFSGSSFPLTILPGWLQAFARVFPLRFTYSLPLEIYFGRVGNTELLVAVAIQTAWVVSLVFLFGVLWRRGLKVYSAFGS